MNNKVGGGDALLAKVECVMQDGPKDCGVCCLLTLMRLYGGNASKEYLRELTHTTKEGVSAYHLLETAKKLGFDGRGFKSSIDQLDEFMLPCIAHVILKDSYPHFVVLYQINRKRNVVVLLDPALGKRKVSFEDFDKIATNQFLYLKPKRKIPVYQSHHLLKHTLFFLVFQSKKILFFTFFLSLLYTVLNMIGTFHVKFLMDYVFAISMRDNIKTISIFVLFLILFQLLLSFFRQCLLQHFEKNMGHSLMECMIQQMLTLPYPYYKNRTTGEMIARIRDLEEVKQFLSRFFGRFFLDLLCVILMLWGLFWLSVPLTTMVLIMIGLSFGILFFFRFLEKYPLKEVQEKSIQVSSLLTETIQGVESIKGMHIEYFMMDKINHLYFHVLTQTKKFHFLFMLGQFLKEHILQIGFVFLLWKGSVLVLERQLTLAQFLAFQNLYYYLFQSLEHIYNFYLEFQSITLSFRRLEELFDVKTELFLEEKNKSVKVIKGDITFCDLSYSYQEERSLLNHLSLHIKAGQKVVLYGPSGSGKSTLAKLLFRYYQVPEDNILLDQVGINHYLLEDIRKYMTYISQQEMLFTDTIYHNIVLNQDVNYETFLTVCRIAKVDEIVKDKVLGYEKMMEENGFNLSGGERQRIILARALLKASNIFIFDEAFNQIDSEKEREILKEVFCYLKEKTVIVISHRENNQDLFDRIIRMEEGTCREVCAVS